MSTQIKCPYCNKSFEPTDAYKHELEEKLLKETQLQHQKEVGRLKREKQEIAESKEKEIEEAKRKTAETVRQEIEVKIRKELESKIAVTQEEAQAREKQNKELQEQVKGMFKQMRELKDEKDKLSIEYEKKLLEGQDKIKQAAKKEAQDELSLRIAEKDKKLQDAEKQILKLQQKIQQGSQQLQGEVMELALEDLLSSEFPVDEIKPVPKGIRGGDVIQVVKDQRDRKCGTILWESKNAKWSKVWVEKLKEDQRTVNAQVAILVSVNLPEDIKGFGQRDGVWITNRESLISLTYAIRSNIIQVSHARAMGVDKDEKMEVLYQYITSTEFKHRVEAIVEAFTNLQNDMETEKRWFNRKWARQEKEIRKVIDNTQGLYGNLQGITGRALPQIEDRNFLPEREEEEEHQQ